MGPPLSEDFLSAVRGDVRGLDLEAVCGVENWGLDFCGESGDDEGVL